MRGTYGRERKAKKPLPQNLLLRNKKSTIRTRRAGSGPGAHCAGALSITLPEGGEKRPDSASAQPFSRHVSREARVT